MIALVLFTFAVFAVTAQTAAGLTDLTGQWASTVEPKPGEAPAVPPRFRIDVKGDAILIAMEGAKEPYPATAFRASPKETLLMFRRSGQTMILRPLKPGEIRLEVFTEYTGSRSVDNFYYSEVFRRTGK
jgi:hypothetical protein